MPLHIRPRASNNTPSLFTYSGGTRSPVSRTDFTVDIRILECFHQSQHLIHTPAHWQVVDGDLAHNTHFIDDEQSSGRGNMSLVFITSQCQYRHPRHNHTSGQHLHQDHLQWEHRNLWISFLTGLRSMVSWRFQYRPDHTINKRWKENDGDENMVVMARSSWKWWPTARMVEVVPPHEESWPKPNARISSLWTQLQARHWSHGTLSRDRWMQWSQWGTRICTVCKRRVFVGGALVSHQSHTWNPWDRRTESSICLWITY